MTRACRLAGLIRRRMGRARVAPPERVAKDELFLPGTPLYGQSFTIEKLSLGYIYDFAHWAGLACGVGGLASEYGYPAALNASYGYRPTSFMLFVRVRTGPAGEGAAARDADVPGEIEPRRLAGRSVAGP
jgi:hypothetical protein